MRTTRSTSTNMLLCNVELHFNDHDINSKTSLQSPAGAELQTNVPALYLSYKLLPLEYTSSPHLYVLLQQGNTTMDQEYLRRKTFRQHTKGFEHCLKILA